MALQTFSTKRALKVSSNSKAKVSGLALKPKDPPELVVKKKPNRTRISRISVKQKPTLVPR